MFEFVILDEIDDFELTKEQWDYLCQRLELKHQKDTKNDHDANLSTSILPCDLLCPLDVTIDRSSR